MKTKILGLLTVALLAGPMSANAGYLYDFWGSVFDNPGTWSFSFESPDLITTTGYFSVGPVSVLGTSFSRGYFEGNCFGFGTAGATTGVDCGFGNQSTGQSMMYTNFSSSPTAVGTYTDYTSRGCASAGGFCLRILGLTISSTSVPEPGSLALLSLGIVGLAFTRRRKDGSAISA